MAICSINPTTGVEFVRFVEDDDQTVAATLQAAADAVSLLAEAGWTQRARWMHAAADLLEAETEEVAALITAEMGKPIGQSRGEVAKSAYTMRYYADHAEEFLGAQALEDPSAVGAVQAGTRFYPLGVVLAVMPWNYPIWQVIRFAAPALMAGNTGVLKHASNVPQAARYLGELFTRAGFPAGSFATLLIGSAKVADVIRDPRVAAVTLTGSEGAGKAVATIAGEVLKKAVLELGGSDPFIVMPSADLDAAVETAVKARTTNNGQACINAKRFIVHTDIYEEFTERFAASMAVLSIGDPADPDTEIGPLATESGRAEVEELVEDARVKGARIRVGGTRPAGAGWFYAPTVVEQITPQMRLFHEEAFGPVAALYRAASLADALRIANQVEFGLGAAFWSASPEEIEQAIGEIQSGAVFVNGMTITYPELPFGGIKRSGYGRELAGEGIREFCNLKTVWIG